MEEKNQLKTAKAIGFIAKYSLLTIGIAVFLFSLVAGSEAYGGGIIGIVKNSPNALPWLTLLVFTFIAWKREMIGGILVALLGIIMLYFFNTGANFFISTFILTLLIAILGLMLIFNGYVKRKYE